MNNENNIINECPLFTYCQNKKIYCYDMPYEKCCRYLFFLEKMYELYNMKPEDFLKYIGV